MVKQWVKDIVEECSEGRPLRIGDVVKHPDGRTVKIVAGKYWSKFGLSNFWYWQEVKDDGSLGESEHGYGWRVKDE